MKKKNLKIIVVLAAVLTLVALILFFTQSNNTLRRELKDFAIKDTSVVSRVLLADKQGERIEIKRNDGGLWILNDSLEAKQSMVNTLLETVLKMRVREPVPKSSFNNVVSRMSAKSVKVDIFKNAYRVNIFNWIKWFPYEKRIKSFFVGDNTQDNQGTHMLLENSTAPFVVHILGHRGFLNTRFSVLLEDWRDPSVFTTQFSHVRKVEVTLPNKPEQSYSIEKTGDRDFNLIPKTGIVDFEVDSIRVLRLLSSFSDLKFETLISNMDPLRRDSIFSSNPFVIISLTDDQNKTVTVKNYYREASEEVDFLGEPIEYDPDRFYMYIVEQDLLVLSQYFVFSKVMRPLDFLKKMPE